MLRHFVSTDQRDWDLFLSLAEFSMNNWYQSSIQCTRFQLVYNIIVNNTVLENSCHSCD